MAATNSETRTREVIYVGDPMCSWCWGIAPELERLRTEHPELPLRIVVGGLRPGPAADRVTDRTAEFLAEHWRHVHEASGRPFDHSILERRDWIYDTEPPCRAVVTMRFMHPEAELDFFAYLQRAFYAGGTIISDEGFYTGLVAEFAADHGVDVDVDEFLAHFRSEEMRRMTLDDFATAQRWGITGFPTVLAREDKQAFALTRGWAPYDRIETALYGVFEPVADGRFCEPGGVC